MATAYTFHQPPVVPFYPTAPGLYLFSHFQTIKTKLYYVFLNSLTIY